MAYQTLQEFNITTGMDSIIVYVATALPFFIPMFLIVLWLALLTGIYFGTKRMNNQGDFSTAMAASSFITAIVSTILTFTAGIINSYTLTISIIMFILAVVFLFISRKSYG